MDTLKTIFFLVLFLCIAATEGIGNEYNCRTNLYPSEEFRSPKVHFFIHEKVFLQTVCHDLVAGEHKMEVVWYNPLGDAQRQGQHSFYLKSVSGYSTFFWIKIQKKGPLRATLSNESYATKFYGNWNVRLYLDESEIESLVFRLIP